MKRYALQIFVRLLPLLIMIVGGVETWLVWSRAQSMEAALRDEEFAARSDEIVSAIQVRLQASEQIINGVSGLLEAHEAVSRKEFHAYLHALHLDEFHRGSLIVGFAPRIDATLKAAHEARIRAEGFSDYTVRPAGIRAQYAPIMYLEPFSGRNLKAFGYDMYSEAVRRDAMVRAMETGKAAMSGKVTLVQENQIAPQAGFLIYAPVYPAKADGSHPKEDRLAGWAYSALRVDDMMQELLVGRLAALRYRVKIDIYDNDSVEEGAHIFDSNPDISPLPPDTSEQTRTLAFGGRVWTVRTRAFPHFDDRKNASRDTMLALSGAVVTLMLALFALAARQHRDQLKAALEKAEEANHALHVSRAHLQLIYDTSGVAIFLVDLAGRITHANHSMEEMFACTREDLIGSEYIAHIHPDKRETGRQKMLALLASDIDHVDLERLYWRKDGTEFWGNLRGQRMLDENGVSVGLVGVILNVDERRKLQAELEQRAHTDSLTGVANRRHFIELAAQELARSQRYERPLSVLMIDVDHFKRVNDSHGHSVGDEVLSKLTSICVGSLRETDIIGRMGGEEFAVVLPETPPDQARETAERLRAAVDTSPIALAQGLPLHFTISVGVASLSSPSDNLDTLLSRADEALYAAKDSGRNRVSVN